jgi:osmotically-inducible protein OsmY
MRFFDMAKDEANRSVHRARRSVGAEPRGPGWLGAGLLALGGAAAGAIAAFLADPARGRARRARIIDQGSATVRKAGREASRVVRSATSSAEGRIQAMQNGGSRVAPTDDVTLRDRAETELFRDPDVPKGQININVERGVLVLRGEVSDEKTREELVRRAEGIEGVWSVRSLLHLPGEPAEEMAGSLN